jgi:hypothetical protein
MLQCNMFVATQQKILDGGLTKGAEMRGFSAPVNGRKPAQLLLTMC